MPESTRPCREGVKPGIAPQPTATLVYSRFHRTRACIAEAFKIEVFSTSLDKEVEQ